MFHCPPLLQSHSDTCGAQVLLPQLEALNADIMVLSADTDCERRKREAAGREVAELQDKLQQVCSSAGCQSMHLICHAHDHSQSVAFRIMIHQHAHDFPEIGTAQRSIV